MRVSENPHHPRLLRLAPEGMTAKALDAVLAAHPDRGFICTVEAQDVEAAKQLEARGFTFVRRTLEGLWQGAPAAPLPNFAHGTLATRPDLTELWLAAHRQHYAATHSANPPAKDSSAVFLGEDFRPEAAFCILADGQLAAFSSLRPADEGWELAWFGTTPENHPDFAMLNAGLVALETGFMAKRSISAVLVEWDSTSPDAAWRTARYALEDPREYLTFIMT